MFRRRVPVFISGPVVSIVFQCNDYVKASKRLMIRRAPNILTVALKRFQTGRFGKLNKRVTFPESLNITPYVREYGDGNDIYRLYAVVIHVDMLNSSYFGHYICYVKDFSDNWYKIDDDKVRRVDLEEVLSQSAYMLLYSSLFSALSYGAASMAMVFINKAVLMQYVYSMTLLTFQQLATTLLIYFLRMMGYTKVKGLTKDMAKKLLPISLFYNANVAFSLASLAGVNIPMYIALKRLTPLAVLVVGFFFGKGWPGSQVLLSVILTTAGVIVAAVGDFSFDLFGYSMALISVFFQTMYLVLVERSGAEDGLSSMEIMLYNSILSLPFLFFLITVTGEFPSSSALLFAKSMSLSFTGLLLLSLVMGVVLNFTMFLCTIVNSALTTTIVGVLKGVGSTALGFFLLGGVEVHTVNACGLMINTGGGVWYSYAKYHQALHRKKNRNPPGP